MDIPTPSLISQQLSNRFRIALLVMLCLDLLYYFFGSFTSAGDLSAVDLVLIFLGYYAQDLFRKSALQLYTILSIVSTIIDTLVIGVTSWYIIRYKLAIWALVFELTLYSIETGAKIASMIFARRLYKHLLLVPGQSINEV